MRRLLRIQKKQLLVFDYLSNGTSACGNFKSVAMRMDDTVLGGDGSLLENKFYKNQ